MEGVRVVRGGVKPFAMVGVKLSYLKGRAARLRRRCPGSLLALPEKKKMVWGTKFIEMVAVLLFKGQ